MKVWNAFGSSHSAHLIVVGEFKDMRTAEDAQEVLRAFVDFACSESPTAKDFIERWKAKYPAVWGLGPSDEDLRPNWNDTAQVRVLPDCTVEVAEVTGNDLNGLIKVMLLNDPKKIIVSGRNGP